MTNSENTQYEKVPTREIIHEPEKAEIPESYGYGVRHIQCLLFFICLSIAFIARGHLSVTIVAMTQEPNKENVLEAVIKSKDTLESKNNETKLFDNIDNETELTQYESNEHVYKRNLIFVNGSSMSNNSESSWNVYRTYTWPKSKQEMVLGSFFLGYCIMMFPSGIICQRWGGKIPLQIALSINGIVSILTPWLAVWGGWKAVCFCRVAQGLSQAGFYPSITTLVAKWVPLSERGRLGSYVHTGTTFGTVVAFQLSGFLADSSWGWPATFWATGVLCLIVFALLTVFGAATPAQHKFISAEEKNFILGRIDDGVVRRHQMPWKEIFTSRHVWGTMATHIGCGVSFVFFFTQVPTYLHHILGVDVKNSGMLSSLPYVVSFGTCIGFGLLSDYCTNKKILSLKHARIICNSIGQIGPAICLMAVSFTRSTAVAVGLFVLSLGMHAGIHTGWMINYIDLSPNCSGTLMATGNTITNFFVLALPLLVSNIVTDMTNQFQWRIMLFLMATLTLGCNTIFVLLMSAEKQPWDDCEYEKSGEEDKKYDTEKEAKDGLSEK